MSVDRRLETVFNATSRDALAKTYDDWAASYDADMHSIGYVNPSLIVGLVCRYVSNSHAAILDAGVGTGTIGQILNIIGYSNLIGIDMSDGMLARAAVRNVYSDLRNQVLGEPLSFANASIDCMISTGTFTTGHAPASAFDELVRIIKPGGILIFSVGTKVWSDAGFDTKLASLPVTEVAMTKPYHPMPLSETESGFTSKALVYRRR